MKKLQFCHSLKTSKYTELENGNPVRQPHSSASVVHRASPVKVFIETIGKSSSGIVYHRTVRSRHTNSCFGNWEHETRKKESPCKTYIIKAKCKYPTACHLRWSIVCTPIATSMLSTFSILLYQMPPTSFSSPAPLPRPYIPYLVRQRGNPVIRHLPPPNQH